MRYKCIVSYDGAKYHGFQVQKNQNSIQKELEDALLIINKKSITIHPAGRTDARVHALGQVFHFDSDIEVKEYQMKNAINSRLPQDIYIKNVEIVDDSFHARYSALNKTYKYLIDLGPYNPLLVNYRYFYKYKLDLEAMKTAVNAIIGEHDFKSFSKNKDLENTIRIINYAKLSLDDNLLCFEINGSGFLHNMIRIIMAMLIEVGRTKISPKKFAEILAAKNSTLAPKIVPANGLYLVEVYY